MCLAKIVFALFAWSTVTNYVFVSGQENEEVTEPPEEKTDPPPVENHTFVAIIEILFVDGFKRQCTGTIIHDNVVVTAAHCFLSPKYTDIELSGSFVVMGTKKMFDTGYENYLPIERIITHPRYKGWTADLALVFTFAGMITDKPGYAIPLVGETVTTPVDSNVTILSWGRCAEGDEKSGGKWPGDKKKRCSSSDEDNDSCEPYKPLREGSRSWEQERSSEEASTEHRPLHEYKSDTVKEPLERVTTAHNAQRVLGIINKHKQSPDHSLDELNNPKRPHEPLVLPHNMSIEVVNQTITDSSRVAAEAKLKENLTRDRKQHKSSGSSSIVNIRDSKWPKGQLLVERRSGHNTSLLGETVTQTYNNKWRRQNKALPTKDSTLTVETFGFVNVQTCKKFVDKSLPPLYGINTNEVVCYAADEHYISDDDSGAPAIRKGHLVAVTVGGVECDGDHVAIGMKMNCFCSWIAENLPEPNVDWKCCADCCKGDEPKKKRTQRNKHDYE